jgi:hypothetical protein
VCLGQERRWPTASAPTALLSRHGRCGFFHLSLTICSRVDEGSGWPLDFGGTVATWSGTLGSGCWRLLQPANRGWGMGAAPGRLGEWSSGVGGGLAGGGLGMAGWPMVRGVVWAGLFAYELGRD